VEVVEVEEVALEKMAVDLSDTLYKKILGEYKVNIYK